MKTILSCLFLMASVVLTQSELSCYDYGQDRSNDMSERIHLPVVTTSKHITLKRSGKGTVRFYMAPLKDKNDIFSVFLGPLNIKFFDDDVQIEESGTYDFVRVQIPQELPVKLVSFKASSQSIWVSFYSSSVNFDEIGFIKIGHGYAMDKNTLYIFKTNLNSTKYMMGNIANITLDDKLNLTSCSRYDKDAVIVDSPPLLRTLNETILTDLDFNFVTYAELPMEGQILYSKVGGPNVKLSDEHIKGIQYSLDNKGCCLHEILNEKDLHKPGFGYIRVTFPRKFGNSPGHPYVLEIWPKLHSSPIHNHGNTVAVIKVLHGTIKSEYFNPLAFESYETEQIRSIMSVTLKKGEITWMTPDIYQTHRLINENPDEATITIQAYSHLDSELFLDEKFNYLESNFPADPHLKPFYPELDLYYDDLINTVVHEYTNKQCITCLRGTGNQQKSLLKVKLILNVVLSAYNNYS